MLLAEKGFDVTGYYFDVTGCNRQGLKEAQELAHKLGIQLICEDVSSEFNRLIINDFCDEYMSGRTPNPCVICNPQVKFRKLIEKADEIGAYHIATGHYCRIYFDKDTGLFYPKMSASKKKDQSYMLYRLGQDVLRRLIFPLGDFEDKEQIRDIAKISRHGKMPKRRIARRYASWEDQKITPGLSGKRLHISCRKFCR